MVMDTTVDLVSFQAALVMCGLNVNMASADLIERVYLEILKKGRQFSIDDASNLVHQINEKYKSE